MSALPRRALWLGVLSLSALGVAACRGHNLPPPEAPATARTNVAPKYSQSEAPGATKLPPPEAPATARSDLAPRYKEATAPVPGATKQPAEKKTPPKATAYDQKRVDSGYLQALKDYRTELGRVRAGDTREHAHVRAALNSLAAALEHVPNSGDVDVREAASRIRSSADKVSIATPSDPAAQAREAQKALDSAADTLVSLGEGPYKDAPNVLKHAKAAKDITGKLGSESTMLRRKKGDVTAALEQQYRALDAIRLSIGRGIVGGK